MKEQSVVQETEGYKNVKEHERNGEIGIYYHAAVSGGKLYPDK